MCSSTLCPIYSFNIFYLHWLDRNLYYTYVSLVLCYYVLQLWIAASLHLTFMIF